MRARCSGWMLDFLLAWMLSFAASQSLHAQPYAFERIDNISIATFDGLKIKANLLLPRGLSPGETFPAVVFLNPFGQPSFVYDIQAKLLAKSGYMAVRFTPRGWRSSMGRIAIGQAAAVEDVKACLEWLKKQPAFNGQAAIVGISEGASTSLHLASEAPEVKAIVAMSAWTDLNHPANGESEPLFWGAVLRGISTVRGARFEPNFRRIFHSMFYRNRKERHVFHEHISPITKLDAINRHQIPIMLSHNLSDTLVPANQVVDFYHKLHGPKRLVLHRGMHAGAEVIGLLSEHSAPWTMAREWLAYWLKHEGERGAPITVDMTRRGYVSVDGLQENARPLTLNMVREQGSRDALMRRDVPDGFNSVNLSFKSVIGSWNGLSLGLPMIEPFKAVHLGWPKVHHLDWVLRSRAGIFRSEPLKTDVCFLGRPILNTQLAFSSNRAQLVFHLIDEDAAGAGRLMTSGVKTFLDSQRNAPINLRHELYFMAYRVPSGHRVALAVDTFDREYVPPTLLPYRVEFLLSHKPTSQLSLPTVDCSELALGRRVEGSRDAASDALSIGFEH